LIASSGHTKCSAHDGSSQTKRVLRLTADQDACEPTEKRRRVHSEINLLKKKCSEQREAVKAQNVHPLPLLSITASARRHETPTTGSTVPVHCKPRPITTYATTLAPPLWPWVRRQSRRRRPGDGTCSAPGRQRRVRARRSRPARRRAAPGTAWPSRRTGRSRSTPRPTTPHGRRAEPAAADADVSSRYATGVLSYQLRRKLSKNRDFSILLVVITDASRHASTC
jgi:hypothetical protein